MADRPDLAAIARRNAARTGGDPARADVIKLLTWIDALEMQLRARAEQDEGRARAMLLAFGKGR